MFHLCFSIQVVVMIFFVEKIFTFLFISFKLHFFLFFCFMNKHSMNFKNMLFLEEGFTFSRNVKIVVNLAIAYLPVSVIFWSILNDILSKMSNISSFFFVLFICYEDKNKLISFHENCKCNVKNLSTFILFYFKYSYICSHISFTVTSLTYLCFAHSEKCIWFTFVTERLN